MRKVIAALTASVMLAGCSTAGGIYKEGDGQHGDFSLGNTVMGVLGVAAAIAVGAAAAKGGGSGGGGDYGFAWDYQPGNAQWVCRNKANGQYAYVQNCAAVPKYDYWP